MWTLVTTPVTVLALDAVNYDRDLHCLGPMKGKGWGDAVEGVFNIVTVIFNLSRVEAS